MSISISGNGTFTGVSTSYSFDQSVSIGGTLTYEDVTNIDSVGVITAQSGVHVTGGSVDIGVQQNLGPKLNVRDDEVSTFFDTTLDNTVFLISNPGAGIGSYGASIGFSRLDSIGRVNAAIAIKQTTSDSDQCGLSFFTHSASNTGASLDESLVIDSSGKLLVGVSSARANFFNGTDTPLLQIEGANNNAQRYLAQVYGSTSSAGPWHIFAKHRSGDIGDTTLVNDDDQLGAVTFQGADGTHFVEGARILAFVDGTPAANEMPARLSFYTNTGATNASPTERMTIAADGTVTFTNTISASGGVSAVTTIDPVYYARKNGTGGNIFQGRNAGGGEVFRIQQNGDTYNSNNVFQALSDLKLKENIVDATSQWSDVKSLRVVNFNFKEETGYDTHRQIGLVAQEVELVSPSLVSESSDRDEDGNDLGTVTKSVAYSVLYMKAVKALQEAMERIETLEQRLADAGIA